MGFSTLSSETIQNSNKKIQKKKLFSADQSEANERKNGFNNPMTDDCLLYYATNATTQSFSLKLLRNT